MFNRQDAPTNSAPTDRAESLLATVDEWIPVVSSNVKAILYHPDTSTLFVKFLAKKNSPESTYAYGGVPHTAFLRMLAAPSKGAFVHKHLKSSYAYSKVG